MSIMSKPMILSKAIKEIGLSHPFPDDPTDVGFSKVIFAFEQLKNMIDELADQVEPSILATINHKYLRDLYSKKVLNHDINKGEENEN